jgi:hypothetical protein
LTQKPAHCSQVDPSQHAASNVAPPSRDADIMPREAPGRRPAQGSATATVTTARGLRAGTGVREESGASSRRNALVPDGVTAYSGQEFPSSMSSNDGAEIDAKTLGADGDFKLEQEKTSGAGAGEVRGKEGQSIQSSLDNRPSQDYMRREGHPAPWRESEEVGGSGWGGGGASLSSFARLSGDGRANTWRKGGASAAGKGGEVGAVPATPKRGPGSGKRLAASAAYLSPDDMESYLDVGGSGRGGAGGWASSVTMLGPGPQSFVGVKSDNTPSEMSGDSDVGRRLVCHY